MRININFASRKFLLFRKVYVIFLVALAAGIGAFGLEYRAFNEAAAKAAVLERRMAAQEKTQRELIRQVSGLKKDVPSGEMQSLAQEAEFANAAIAKKVFSWTAFLNRLEDVVPDGVGITSINPDFNSLNVNISGTALSMAQATEFIDRLTQSPYFEDIPPVFHTSETLADKDIGKTLQVFNLRIKYNPEGRKADAAGRKDGRP